MEDAQSKAGDVRESVVQAEGGAYVLIGAGLYFT
jgi:hypothetical protein